MYPGYPQTPNPLASLPMFWDYGHAQLFPLYLTPFRPRISPITIVSLDFIKCVKSFLKVKIKD